MKKRVDFSANATVYDRRHGATLSDDELGRLWEAGRLQTGALALDIGAGTGRAAIPLAARGCRVCALEPARGMLDQLRTKASGKKLHTVVGEGAHLPFPNARFEVVVIARLLYLTADWREILREAHRVLVDHGCLFHEWGNGQADEEWVQIREQARTLFEQAGVPEAFHRGARTEPEVDQELESLGLVHEAQLLIGPGPEIALREFLRRLVDGELSYTWDVPESVRATCLPRLQHWSARAFDLERPTPMPRDIHWAVYRKHAALAAGLSQKRKPAPRLRRKASASALLKKRA